MKKKRKIGIFVVAVILILGSISAVKTYQYYSRQISGMEWLKQQEKYITDLKSYSENMDNIFTLYITGGISQEDFLNHLSVLNDELTILKADYQKAKEEHPVRTGSHTHSTKSGCEAVEKCYDTLSNLIEVASSKENYSNTDILSYKYIVFRQEITDQLSIYTTSLLYATEEDKQSKQEDKK